MLFKPLLGTDLSGKVGGIVASHNAGGAYFKAATIPTNPNTVFQQAVRTAVAALTVRWNDSLTPAERSAWEVYADNVLLTNRIGDQVNVSGLAMYVRSNVSRLQRGGGFQDTAPTIFNLGAFDQGDAENATEAAQTIDIDFGSTISPGIWLTELGSHLLVYVSRPQNPSINFFKGPYRFVAALSGDPVPPVTPFTVTAPFAFVAGQRIFTRCVVGYLDGRLTADIRSNTLAVA